MIYLQHNLKDNILSADGTKDLDMKQDIIMSEIAKLISMKSEVIIAYLKASGIKISDNASDRTLTKAVVNGISNSKQFTALLAEEILGKGRASRVLNSDGAPTGTGTNWSNVDYGAMAQSTASLFGSIKDLFGKDKPKSPQILYTHTQAVNAAAGYGMATSTKVLIGVAIAIPLLIGGFFAIRAINR